MITLGVKPVLEAVRINLERNSNSLTLYYRYKSKIEMRGNQLKLKWILVKGNSATNFQAPQMLNFLNRVIDLK